MAAKYARDFTKCVWVNWRQESRNIPSTVRSYAPLQFSCEWKFLLGFNITCASSDHWSNVLKITLLKQQCLQLIWVLYCIENTRTWSALNANFCHVMLHIYWHKVKDTWKKYSVASTLHLSMSRCTSIYIQPSHFDTPADIDQWSHQRSPP